MSKPITYEDLDDLKLTPMERHAVVQASAVFHGMWKEAGGDGLSHSGKVLTDMLDRLDGTIMKLQRSAPHR